ncbi:MAG: T9SS type A sorting domain-containing protein [Bacteroidales bacterium]|nr:T9SS type A sorting domain-containing protein [Bacteroidales bacterium]
MKKILLIGYFLVQFFKLSFSQISQPVGNLIFTDTLDFRPLCNWIEINNPVSNIWEIGHPNKGSFNSAHSGALTIITDSTSMYKNNLNDYFSITIPYSDLNLGEGILSFYHKYESDSLIDGGIIEVSYNNGVDWKNICDDKDHAMTNFIGLYNDTIKGGNYGFSGSSYGWQYVELHWVWIMLTKSSTFENYDKSIIRFRFISDNISTNKEGWMIDDIVFRGYDISGGINEMKKGQIKAFPNPTNGKIFFNFPEKYNSNLKVEIIDINGRTVLTKFPINGQIDITNNESGTYVYKVYHKNELISSGKLIKF